MPVQRGRQVTTVSLIKENAFLVGSFINPCPDISIPLQHRAPRPTHAYTRLSRESSRGEVYTLMDRARSFATIGRALYMAHGAPRFPISVKVEKRSRSPSERELRALQMDFTVSTKEEQRGSQHDPSVCASCNDCVVYILIRE